MKKCFSLCLFFLILIHYNPVPFLTASSPNVNEELSGYWAIQSVSINGHADKGEEGSYLILRKNGTFRIAKKGRKPAGTWKVNKNNQLVFKIKKELFLKADWSINDNELTLSYSQGDARVVLKYLKETHETEPKAPDED